MENKRKIVVASELGIRLQSVTDVSHLLEMCLDADGVLLSQNDLPPAFFDLRSGFAGELLQKFINYRVRVALVVRNPEAYGDRFNQLSYEHDSHAIVRFVRSEDDARGWLLSG